MNDNIRDIIKQFIEWHNKSFDNHEELPTHLIDMFIEANVKTMDLKELKTGKYYNTTFTFKHLYKSTVMYEHKDGDKKVTVVAEVGYRSDLNTEETLNSLDCQLDITDITIS